MISSEAMSGDIIFAPAAGQRADTFVDSLSLLWLAVADRKANLFIAKSDGTRGSVKLAGPGQPAVLFYDDGIGAGPSAFGETGPLAHDVFKTITLTTGDVPPATAVLLVGAILSGKSVAVILTPGHMAPEWERTLANWFRIDWTSNLGGVH